MGGAFRHTMEMIGLKELILTQHPNLKPPPTRQPDSHTIDEIFGRSALDVVRGGYTPFVGYTDHILSRVDARWDSALGSFQKIQRLLARRLQYDKPRLVIKYVQYLKSY